MTHFGIIVCRMFIHIVCQPSSILFVDSKFTSSELNLEICGTKLPTSWTNGEKCNECNNPDGGRDPAMDETHDCFLLCLICSQLFLLVRTLDIVLVACSQSWSIAIYALLWPICKPQTLYVITIDVFTDEWAQETLISFSGQDQGGD